MTNKYDETKAYRDMLNEEFTNASGAPVGAMSSGPELNKLMRPTNPDDVKFSIYNVINPKKKKKFESKDDAQDYMNENDGWTWELKESLDMISYNAELMENNPELYKTWLELKEQAELIHYETRKYLEEYDKK